MRRAARWALCIDPNFGERATHLAYQAACHCLFGTARMRFGYGNRKFPMRRPWALEDPRDAKTRALNSVCISTRTSDRDAEVPRNSLNIFRVVQSTSTRDGTNFTLQRHCATSVRCTRVLLFAFLRDAVRPYRAWYANGVGKWDSF
jgi:hypothetical protein